MFFCNKRDLSNTLLEEWADQQSSGSYLVFINDVLAKKNTQRRCVGKQSTKHTLPLINIEAIIYTGGP